MFAWVWREIKKAVNKAIDSLFRAVFGGVLRMIENFRRIVCFLESLPLRARNVTSGVQNIFEGVAKKVEAIGKSINAGAESTGSLFAYTGEYAGTRLECVVQFIKNFYKCAIFYFIRILCEIVYAIITLPFIFIGYLFGLDVNNRVFKPATEGLIYASSLLGIDIEFHLKYFTKNIYKDCFSCRRLKDSALENAGKRWGDTFTKEIPQIMKDGGAKEFRRAKNQFNEASVLIPREPHLVH
tara:strand:- start:823 stop:1542 length:720 start_codon:yes stop_codon:yes gene_type:complete